MSWVLIQLIIKALLIFAVIPALIGYYFELGKSLTGTRFKRWALKNWAFWVLLVLLIPAVWLEIRFSNHSERPEERPLEFLDLAAYQAELDQYTPQQPSANWLNEKQQLARIFEHAQYAWKTADYNEATNALMTLETGQDQVGALQKVASYVVSNDLGCSYYKQQRNKEFKAFTFFQEAKNRAGLREPYRTRIEKNIKLLDEMVNSLD